MEIRDKVLEAVERYELIAAGDRLLLGVSGGQDSVTLALILTELAQDLQVSLVVAHLNHGLRGETAEADAACVRRLAGELGWPFVAGHTDVGALAAEAGVGLEEAGRLARYRFFEQASREQSCSKVALGHTATDRAETFLINLFRGAGVHGLRSIPPRRGPVIRPLLLLTRQETAEYCRRCGVAVCSDEYNASPQYLRNRLRQDLLPQLERDFGPGIEAALCRAADHLHDELEWTEPLVAETLAAAQAGQGLCVAALREVPRGLRYRVLRAFLQQQGVALRDLGRERWQALETLMQRGGSGREMELCSGRRVELEYGLLRVAEADCASLLPATALPLPVPGRLALPGGGVLEALVTDRRPPLPKATESRAVLDLQRAGQTLLVRAPRPGDRFRPLGMTGSKKLQDFFVDAKVPRRDRRPLLVARPDGEILWVVGHRVSEAARIGSATREYLVLSSEGRVHP